MIIMVRVIQVASYRFYCQRKEFLLSREKSLTTWFPAQYRASICKHRSHSSEKKLPIPNFVPTNTNGHYFPLYHSIPITRPLFPVISLDLISLGLIYEQL